MNKIEVHVQVFGAAQIEMGWKTKRFLLPESSTIAAFIGVLAQTHPSITSLVSGGEHSLACLILVNGCDIKKREGLSTTIQNGDKIDIISMISGG